MRTSSQRTPVAILRNIIGQKTDEFAKMVGLSLSAVEKLESGRLKISEDVAQKISFETSVDAHWLLDGDPQMPPFLDIAAREYLSPQPGKDYQEALYSKEVFDRVRAARLAKKSPIPEGEHTLEGQIICLLFRLLCIYESARSNGEDPMALYRLHNIEGDLAKEFGCKPALELASKAGRSLQKLANRLKHDQKDLRDLAFEPGKADPVKFLELCHRIAKAMSAINAPRKGGSSKAARRKTQPPVPSKERVPASAESDATRQPLTEDQIRALFDPVRNRMKAKGHTEHQIRARLDAFRKRQREAEGKA